MLAVWAEMDVVLADEFRDGNVPAQMAPLTVAKAAFAAAPKTVTSYYYRGDSACCHQLRPYSQTALLPLDRVERRIRGAGRLPSMRSSEP
jgi:hypothetical protein